MLDAPWILDIDTTVKPLYGKQEGAVVSYNPSKPGRPSHTYHTYLMAGVRLVVGAEVKAGDEHAGSHSLPALLKRLDALPTDRRPRIVRGDCGFGSDSFMAPLKDRQQSYLFKLRLSKNVKRHIERVSGMRAGEMPAKAGKARTASCVCRDGKRIGASSCCAAPSRVKC